jgi:molybdate transport system ATP-binding protein
VFARFEPRAVTLHAGPPEGSARNRWPVTVTALDQLGDRIRVHAHGAVPLAAEITAAAAADLNVHEGQPLWAAVKATEITTYPV